MDVKSEVTDKYCLRGRVFSRIREDILSGNYHKNDELKETVIASQLGVSRTPVREAFRQLELEGLIQVIPNKGAYVTGITKKDIRDIYMVRSMLEGLCARLATENINSVLIKQMEDNIELTEFHNMKGNNEKIFELDNKFHELLYEAAESKILLHVMKDLHEYVQRVRKITLSTQRAIASTGEHKDIVEAIKERDAKKAEQLADYHILKTIENLEINKIDELIVD